jgi:hypothetical protein
LTFPDYKALCPRKKNTSVTVVRKYIQLSDGRKQSPLTTFDMQLQIKIILIIKGKAIPVTGREGP